jgi:uncharacterized membrane protein
MLEEARTNHMKSSDTSQYALAAGLGAIAGMRSMSAPALLSCRAMSGEDSRLKGTPLASTKVAALLWALAAGEMIADKLPGIPDRTSPPALIARACSGAFAGAALFNFKGRSCWVAAAIGAATAVAVTYGSYHLRQAAGKQLDVPDRVVAVAEDAVVVGSGIAVLQAA